MARSCSSIVCGFALAAVLGSAAAACASSPPPRTLSPSSSVERLRRESGPTLQDCGEAQEGRDEEKCKIQPVLACVHAALKSCRAAQGTHQFLAGEGDPVRIDYFVVERPGGACDFVVVEDRTADPLAPRAPSEMSCSGASWKPHPSIPSCEVLEPMGCRPGSAPSPAQSAKPAP